MKRILLILAACAWACAWAGVMSARLGALGRNDTVVTNVTDVTPGNYETVSNRAMTANNYTDEVAADIRQNYIPISGGPIYSSVDLFLNDLLHEQRMIRFELPDRTSADAQSFVGSSQITNQGAVAAATAMVFYDTTGGAASVSGATLTYQAASNSVGSVELLAGTNVLHITAPSAIRNRVRDFGLTVTTDDAATITLDTSVSWRFDSASTNLSAGSWNRIYCTESPTGVFSLQLWTPDSAQEDTP